MVSGIPVSGSVSHAISSTANPKNRATVRPWWRHIASSDPETTEVDQLAGRERERFGCGFCWGVLFPFGVGFGCFFFKNGFCFGIVPKLPKNHVGNTFFPKFLILLTLQQSCGFVRDFVWDFFLLGILLWFCCFVFPINHRLGRGKIPKKSSTKWTFWKKICWSLPSLKLTASTWKWMVGVRSFPLRPPIFRGELFVSGRVKDSIKKTVQSPKPSGQTRKVKLPLDLNIIPTVDGSEIKKNIVWMYKTLVNNGISIAYLNWWVCRISSNLSFPQPVVELFA